jgi:predicted transcriptional regulator
MTRRCPMDKILSARVDESVVNRIGSLARRLHTSKKKVIESAIRTYAAQVDKEQDFDVFEHTSGAWQKKESAGETVAKARKAFRESMRRHRQ